MGFLAPWYFALAAAAAVPLLLHLLRRRIGTRVDFPAVRYLVRAEQEQSARLRLRNWLLMALRVLAVLLVALAAARPVARAGAGHVPASIAIVLDNSLSTSAVAGGRPVFEELRAAARAVTSAAAADDRLWLVTADGRVVGGGRQAVAAAVERATGLAGAGDLAHTVARAAEVVRGDVRTPPTVVVLTDGQASAWRGTVDVRGARVVVHVAPGAPPRNRAVVSADAVPARWTPGGSVVARILSTDSAAYRIGEVDAAGGGRTLARGTAAPDGEVRVAVRPTATGWLAGIVAVEPDELRGDDQRFFAAFSGPPPSVVADPSAGAFAASALATLAQSGRVGGGGLRPARIAAANAATQLPALLTPPSDPSGLGPANQALERLGVPWRFAALRTGETPIRMTGDSAAAGAVATRRYQLVPRGTARSDTIATTGGEPWIVAGPGYVLVASPLLPEATSFPLRAAFVPWLGDVVAQRLAGDAGRIDAAAPGAPVDVPSGVDGLLGPDGRRLPGGAGTIAAPDRPGVYFWLRGGARAGALVVNVEPDESRLARLAARDVAGRMPGSATRVAATTGDVVTLAYGGEGRRPIGGSVLAAALLALLAEGVVTRRAGAGATRGVA